MLCTVFASRLAHLEREQPMRLANTARALRNARKQLALSAAHYAAAETDKAQRKAMRRTKAARRAFVSAQREAEAWDDFSPA